jgi:hypothetical protein
MIRDVTHGCRVMLPGEVEALSGSFARLDETGNWNIVTNRIEIHSLGLVSK